MAKATEDSGDWRAGQLEGRLIEWTEVMRFGSPERAIGITLDGGWIIALDHGESTELHELGGDAAIAALPLLQSPFSEVKLALERRLTNLIDDWEIELPVDVVYRAALDNGSPFWIGAAASWMDGALPRTISVADLREVASSKRLDQSVRHQLLRVARRLEAIGG